jgi:hypothetical protein
MVAHVIAVDVTRARDIVLRMERRHFLIAWVYGLFYAIFPSLRPKPVLDGTDLRALLAEQGFRTLEVPYVIEEGVPIGLMPPIGLRISPEPMCWTLEEKAGPGKIEYREELTVGTTGGTRVTPAS